MRNQNNLLNIRDRENFILCSVIIILIIGIFWPVFSFEYVVYDDGGYIYSNPRVIRGLTLENIKWAFTTFDRSNWHPLTWLSYLLDIELFGMDPAAQHAVNLFFHILNSIFLFVLLTKITGQRPASLIVAGLFAVHPLHVESVAWISERKDVLSTFFFLMALLCYARYIQKPSRTRYGFMALSYAIGLMAKPMLVTFPFVLLLLDFWPFHRLNSLTNNFKELTFIKKSVPLIIEKIPLFVLSAISCILTFLSQKQGGAVSNIDFFSRVSNAFISYFMYLVKTVAPFHLSAFYPFPNNISVLKLSISCGVLLCLAVIAIKRVRKSPWIFVGLAWYIGTLVPVIGIVHVGDQAMADRYTYIPHIGLFIAAVWSTYFFIKRYGIAEKTIVLLGCMIVLLLSVISAKQVNVWEDSFTLFEHAIKVNENNHVAFNNLVAALALNGKMNEATGYFIKALKIRPEYPEALTNLNVSLGANTSPDQAIEKLKSLIKIHPDNPALAYTLGVLYRHNGELDKAIEEYQRALLENKQFPQAQFDLAFVYSIKGEYEKALVEFKKTIKIRSDLIWAYYYIAAILAAQNRIEESIRWLDRAIEKGFNNWDFLKSDKMLENIRKTSYYKERFVK
jgi:Tfp pilus assembly protein PilF